MSRPSLEALWAQGVRIIHYGNGHRTEIRQDSNGLLWEMPLPTGKEGLEIKIAELEERILRDIEKLEKLKEELSCTK